MTTPAIVTPANVTAAKPMLQDVLETFDGYDEIAITQFFGGKDWTDLTGTFLGRAAVFVLRRRDGLLDGDAYKAAMGMPLREIKATFADDDIDDAQVDTGVVDAAAAGDVDAVLAAAQARAESRPEA